MSETQARAHAKPWLYLNAIGSGMNRFNENVAVKGTMAFGSMWTFWAFFVLGILAMMPFMSDHARTLIQLISSAWIQLWALPLLMVGGIVLNRASEKRAEEDHATIREEFDIVKGEQLMIKAELAEAEETRRDIGELAKLLPDIAARLERIEARLAER
jgi:hypothetical protein